MADRTQPGAGAILTNRWPDRCVDEKLAATYFCSSVRFWQRWSRVALEEPEQIVGREELFGLLMFGDQVQLVECRLNSGFGMAVNRIEGLRLQTGSPAIVH